MIHLSYSMLKDFGECNRKAYYHLKREEKKETASLVTGRVTHDLVDLYEKRDQVDGILKEYRKILAKELNDDSLLFFRWQSPSYFLDWMQKCFENYKAVSAKLPPIVDTEFKFSIPYFCNSFSDSEVRGIFDQVREGNVVCELKTSKQCPEEEFLRADLQATIYIWAYERMHKVTPTYYYIHLPTGSVFELGRDDFSDFYALADEYIDAFETDRWTRKQDGRKCNWCWYNNSCLQDGSCSRFVFKAVGELEDGDSEKRDNFFTY